MYIKNCLFLCTLTCTLYQSHIAMTTYNLVSTNQTRYVSTNNVVQNSARGFAFFTQGIIFDGVVNVSLPVPIMGTLQFGNGNTSKIILESDLTLGSTAGTSSNTLKITTSTGYAEINGANGTIRCTNNIFLPANRAFRILDNVTLDGGGHDIIFDNLTTFTIVSGATLTITNARLLGLNSLNFVGSGTLILDNTTILLDYDWTYSGNASSGTPSLYLKNDIAFTGFGRRFIYAGSQNMYVHSDAFVTFDIGTTFSWDAHRRNGFILGYDQDITLTTGGSYLLFNGSNLAIPSKGSNNGLYMKTPSFFFNNATIAFDHNCMIYNDGNADINKSLECNTSMHILEGARLEVDGYLYNTEHQSFFYETFFNPTLAPYNAFTFNPAWGKLAPFVVTFSVAADHDAIIVLTKDYGLTSGPNVITIIIGANGNTNIVIYYPSPTTYTPPEGTTLLTGTENYTPFWIAWDSSLGVRVGKGLTPWVNTLAEAHPAFMPLAEIYAGFGGWIDPAGSIVFYKNITLP